MCSWRTSSFCHPKCSYPCYRMLRWKALSTKKACRLIVDIFSPFRLLYQNRYICTKKIVVRAKNALTSVRAERFASTEYHGQHFGQKSSFVTVQFLNTDWERAHPHSGPSPMILPIHLECAYMYVRRWGNGTGYGKKLLWQGREPTLH